MIVLLLISALLLSVPATVSACEGECIVGITNAFLGNYTPVVEAVMNDLNQQICANSSIPPNNYLSPIYDAYKMQAYHGMENAIFPSYFHGKCQQDGVNPPGCPNPDCPVVCGTPGSMVHFYSQLRYIAFNQTRHLLETLVAPGSNTYQQVEHALMKADQGHSRRMSRVYGRALAKAAAESASRSSVASSRATPMHGYKAYTTAPVLSQAPPPLPSSAAFDSDPDSANNILVPIPLRKRTDLTAVLRQILGEIDEQLLEACGGDAQDEATNGLPDCSWENEMKEYILTFP
ncbi:uncharacterized protein LAESUDRAFT_699481 [Laetiporus sulphureus 93-53]|uniref:Uncharacterized protein n=1 Tax=Laetiporus sulphureus 93-53 TaxID=1314785 RepID=A0A165EI07_9APHY|nr:uncharacterized protein LAESUDRAFT_699481 [Laetiporus sulphureus 93-53]KZT07090.1 hypothetical protein LAESUDRAFT_699481 [Laetiporus sulphureus 93-53]